MINTQSRTWIEINRRAIRSNVRKLRRIVGSRVKLMAVLKSNAYGHGIEGVVRICEETSIPAYAVIYPEEVLLLRRLGVHKPILLLGDTDDYPSLIRVDGRIIVFDVKQAEKLNRAAAQLHKKAYVHLKVDTGMSRLGVLVSEFEKFLHKVLTFKYIEIEGVMTHFAAADSENLSHANRQLTEFRRVLAICNRYGVSPQYIHAANSAALIRLPRSRFNLVRSGILLYGLYPSVRVQKASTEPFQPALSWKTRIIQIKRIPKGTFVGYGLYWRALHPTTIATLPVGYAEGYSRLFLKSGAYVLIRGKRALLLGRPAMNFIMVDVSRIYGAKVGDEVVLIGKQSREEITADELARRIGTANYEIVTRINWQIPRIFIWGQV